MGSAAEALYQSFVNAGGGHRDFSAIIAMLDGRQPG
jgi:3-hydroxyisobutyrate dehydrogenase-like beta-hydroxyacid dehydrogenase